MAFERSIDPGGVFNADFLMESEGPGCCAVVWIGQDMDKKCIYYIHIGFDESPAGWEYYFFIMQRYPETDENYEYWSGKDTEHLFSEEDRKYIMAVLCKATERFVKSWMPESFLMVPYDANIPDKAAWKFEALIEVFTRVGYQCTAYDPYLGKMLWRFDKI